MAIANKSHFSHKSHENDAIYYNVHLLSLYYYFSFFHCYLCVQNLRVEIQSVGNNTRQQSLTPLLYRFHNDGMIEFVPLFHNFQLQMFDISNSAIIHPLLQHSPYLVIMHGVKVG